MSDKEEPKAQKSTEEQDAEEVEEEAPVTMLDVLQDEESLEADAAAVLGNADDKNCTYHTGGYMKRQALYSCLECRKDNGSAGICLACSYHCHEGHELVELYTKRHFRCDCGNGKMTNQCKLVTDKDQFNQANSYNQNFKGDYCTCHRPYPDPEDSTPDQMIQCILCEDWYHGRHLISQGQTLPKDENYGEMICLNCCEKNASILSPYSTLSIDFKDDTESDKVDVESVEKSDAKKCTKPNVGEGKTFKAQTLFLPSDWRSKLCICQDCTKLYKDNKVEFLIDPEDTVHHYESQAKNESTSQYEKGMEALSAMDRVKQVEAIQGYNSMKANLMEYLKKFADNGKVVRQEDIQEFFQKMAANKRQRVEIPKFCK